MVIPFCDQQPNNEGQPTTRMVLGLEYDGGSFSGWQSQPDGNTLQDHLEKALTTIAKEPIVVYAAGRTDAGVHATQQIVHFDTQAKRPLNAWVRGVNSHLPSTIAVRWAQTTSHDFHARFSALSRRYCYWLLCRPVRPGLLDKRVGWCFQPLDIDIMRQAAQLLLGEHDFSCFRSSQCQAKSPIKTLQQLAITCYGDLWCFDCQANAFLHHMVRNIVSALIYVGKGALTLDAFAALLLQKNRQLAPPTFMPDGLYLTGINYPSHFGLPQEAIRQEPFFLPTPSIFNKNVDGYKHARPFSHKKNLSNKKWYVG